MTVSNRVSTLAEIRVAIERWLGISWCGFQDSKTAILAFCVALGLTKLGLIKEEMSWKTLSRGLFAR